ARTRAAPLVATPTTTNPELTLTAPVAIVDRTVEPAAVIEHRSVINRHVPIGIGASPIVAIATTVVAEADRAGYADRKSESYAGMRRRCTKSRCGEKSRRK